MKNGDEKTRLLFEQGTLNKKADKVKDPLFRGSDFFDPRDLVQVKYEMVRKVEKEGRSVTRTAEAFGFSRPAFYQIKAAFDDKGLSGLIPQKRGPRGRHKLSAEIMDYAISQQGDNPDIGVPELLNMIKRNFGLTVHRRSLERALKKEKKKREMER